MTTFMIQPSLRTNSLNNKKTGSLPAIIHEKKLTISKHAEMMAVPGITTWSIQPSLSQNTLNNKKGALPTITHEEKLIHN